MEVTSPAPPPPPDALIVTIPSPPIGEIVMLVPAISLVTAVERYPVVMIPWTVDCNDDAKSDVLTKSRGDTGT